MSELIILDRDGVINFESTEYVKCPDEWLPIPGSLEAIAKLTQAGIKVAIATNQAGIGRGYFTETDLKNMHQKMFDLLKPLGGKIDAIFYCPHTPDDNCTCRKPKPGLLEKIAAHFEIDLRKERVPFIGDSYRDIEAARSAGCRPMLVLTGFGEKTYSSLALEQQNIPVYPDLLQAVTAFLSK